MPCWTGLHTLGTGLHTLGGTQWCLASWCRDVQSRTNTKMLINRCFNVGKYITTIQGANMNPGVPQCKNCWKWGHATFSCRIQGSKCVKCNGPHKLENHRDFGWCCKANDKINPPRLKTKKGDSCPHTFKCSNCYGNHQADLNACSFWWHCFNREWQMKKYSEIHENRSKSIHSEENIANQQWFWNLSKFYCKMFRKTHSLSKLYSKLRKILISS